MIPVPQPVLESLAASYGTRADRLRHFGGGEEASDGIVYAYPYEDTRRLLKILAIPMDSQRKGLLCLEERLRFVRFLGENGAHIVFPQFSPDGNLYEKFGVDGLSKTPWTSRLYETENDLLQMQALLMEARAQTDDWRYPHVGDLLFWFFMVACHLNPKEHIRLWHDGDKLVGYAILGEDPSFDCQVLPEYAWRGIEEEALTWAENRITELRSRDPQLWGGHLVSGARQDDAQRIAFLEQHGFHPGGEFSEVNMLRTLDGTIPEAVVPAGCQVRPVAEPAAENSRVELSNRAEAQRDVWRPWTVGNVSDDDYACFMRLPGYDRELDIVAVAPDGVIAAYVNGWIDPVNKIGDFGPLGARPAYRRQGLTRAVLLECLRRMQARGMNRVSVSTGVSNIPAIWLYEGVGFKIVNNYLEYVKTD